MRLLIDTHVLLWHLEDNPQLPVVWSEVLEDTTHEKYCSIATLWEIAIKINIGKLTLDYPLDKLVPVDFRILPVEMTHVLAYQQLPLHHRDRNVGPAF